MTNQSLKNEPKSAQLPSFTCEIAAWNVTCLGLPELAALRRDPKTRLPDHVTPQFLKNSDDQTLTSLVALYSGIDGLGQGRAAYRQWGVVSASQFIGRGSFAATLYKYCKDGPWGVSVQVIPHNMLHSISSTISLSLPCNGPCLGAGGGTHGEFDALLLAANLLSDGRVPGVWVTWSSWSPELIINEAGQPESESKCTATALALVPLSSRKPTGTVEIRVSDVEHGDSAVPAEPLQESRIPFSLTETLSGVNCYEPGSFQFVRPIFKSLEFRIDWCQQAVINGSRDEQPALDGTEPAHGV